MFEEDVHIWSVEQKQVLGQDWIMLKDQHYIFSYFLDNIDIVVKVSDLLLFWTKIN